MNRILLTLVHAINLDVWFFKEINQNHLELNPLPKHRSNVNKQFSKMRYLTGRLDFQNTSKDGCQSTRYEGTYSESAPATQAQGLRFVVHHLLIFRSTWYKTTLLFCLKLIGRLHRSETSTTPPVFYRISPYQIDRSGSITLLIQKICTDKLHYNHPQTSFYL